MTSVLRRGVVAVGLAGTFTLGAVLGCSSGSSSPSGPETSIARADWCARQAKAVCAKQMSCCEAAAYATDAAACATREAKSCEDRAAVLEAAGNVYDANAAALCLPHINDSFEGCAPNVHPASYACHAVFTKGALLGEACSDASPCRAVVDGYVHCVGAEGSATCRLHHLGVAGEPCSAYTEKSCGDGFHCEFREEPRDGKCMPDLPKGSTDCGAGAQCMAGLSCTGTGCLEPGVEGDFCNFRACAPGLYCDYKSMDCSPRLPTGSACTVSVASTDSCLETDHCVKGTCTPRAENGAACTQDTDCLGRCAPEKVCASRDSIASPELCVGR